MAVPKRRMSRSNTRHRRSQWKASVPALVTLRESRPVVRSTCHMWLAHRCGQYGPRAARRQVLAS